MSNKRIQVPHITVDNPDLQQFINAIVHNDGLDTGRHNTDEKKPTKQDLVDAGVTNAENIT